MIKDVRLFESLYKTCEKILKFSSCVDFMSFTSLTGMCIFINQKWSKGDENANLNDQCMDKPLINIIKTDQLTSFIAYIYNKIK